MRNAREIAFGLKRIQKVFPKKNLFVVLYEDGSGGLYDGTIEHHKQLMEWPSGEDGCRLLDAEVRKLYLVNSSGYFD